MRKLRIKRYKKLKKTRLFLRNMNLVFEKYDSYFSSQTNESKKKPKSCNYFVFFKLKLKFRLLKKTEGEVIIVIIRNFDNNHNYFFKSSLESTPKAIRTQKDHSTVGNV
jgi:macrodomain Ter protein organizer (MatP/YcbG family)